MKYNKQSVFVAILFLILGLAFIAGILALLHWQGDAVPYIPYFALVVGSTTGIFIFITFRAKKGRPVRRRYSFLTGVWAGLLLGVAMVGFSYTIPPIYAHYFMSTEPYLTWTGTQEPSTAVTVCWVTGSATDSVVAYGISPLNLNLSASESEITRYHQIPITGLHANTTYYYQAGGNALKQFTTAPTGTFNFTFYVWSDPRENNEMARARFRPNMPLEMDKDARARGELPAFSICTGDITSSSQDWETWQLWFQDIATNDWAANRSHAVAFGNHERHGDTEGNALQLFYPHQKQADGRFWYSFNYGHVHFLMLDPYKEGASWMEDFTPEHLAWLEADLATNAQQKIKIGFLHCPALNGGGLQEDLQRLAAQYKISLFLTGHRHTFQDKLVNGVHYIIQGIGGNANNDFAGSACDAGYTSIHVNATGLHVETRWINGSILNAFDTSP